METVDIPVFWISDQQTLHRYAPMKKQLEDIESTHVQATTAHNVYDMIGNGEFNFKDKLVLPESRSTPHQRHIRQEYSVYELACTISHVRAMEVALSRNVGMAFILEDDMNISKIHKRLKLPLSRLTQYAPRDWDILQLYSNNFGIFRSLCGRNDSFSEWSSEYWSTGAYIIGESAMRDIVDRFHTKRGWSIAAPVLADRLIFASARTYTLTRPILESMSVSSTIQPDKVAASTSASEKELWVKIKNNWCSPLLQWEQIQKFQGEEYAVASIPRLEDLDRVRINSRIIANSVGRNALMNIVSIDQRKTAWGPLKDDLFKTYNMRTNLINFKFDITKRFWSKLWAHVQVIGILSSYKYVLWTLFMDADISLDTPRFDASRFLSFGTTFTISQPLIETKDSKSNGQFFRPLNYNYWTGKNKSLHYCSVGWVEQQVTLLDITFYKWFLAQWQTRALFHWQFLHKSDWGFDLLWCRAAQEFGSKRDSCGVVLEDAAMHDNTHMISKNRAFLQDGSAILKHIKNFKWYTDSRRLSATWSAASCH